MNKLIKYEDCKMFVESIEGFNRLKVNNAEDSNNFMYARYKGHQIHSSFLTFFHKI